MTRDIIDRHPNSSTQMPVLLPAADRIGARSAAFLMSLQQINARSAHNNRCIHHVAAVTEESLETPQWMVGVEEEGGCWGSRRGGVQR